ncbi:hypothetical protein Daus18300_013252 [Diaporthe australafricana]|uniref:Uncharacterized protein n=1 Tax=Diaporthe australafricana TaxID=127596 RepID=A0ABR3W015_9PEZI
MRLTFAFAALGLAAGHVAGQQWQDFGAMPDLWTRHSYNAVARSPALAKRDGVCDVGSHPCSDVDPTTDVCCDNTKYCIINATSLDVECCALGSTCGGNCSPDAYFSLSTRTQTTSGSTATATLEVCAARACTSTFYSCPQSMGGNCCAYGQDCASGGQCLAPSTASSTTSSGGAVATMIPSGCSLQGDTACASDGRCCHAGYACTTVSSEPMCAQTSASSPSSSGPAPTGSGISVVSPSKGLSTGARAGIAVGVVVAAALAIGAATWLCIRRRRNSSRSTTTGNELGSNIGGAGGMTRLAAAGRHESDDGGLRAYGPSSGPHMSEADATSSRGGGPLGGLANDYFGPAAASGPYTTPDGYLHEAGTGGGAGAGPQDYLARTNVVRGDGGTPHGPDDIASAVEMGSGKPSLRRKKDGEEGGGGGGMVRPKMPSEVDGSRDGGSELDGSDNMVARQQQQQQSSRQRASSPTVRDSIAGRFELYGTDVTPGAGAADMVDRRAPRPLGTPGSELSASPLGTPSPMSHEEQQQQQQSDRRGAG